jgi:hypothetical protein
VAQPTDDPRPLLEAFFAEVLAQPRAWLHLDTKREGGWPWDDPGPDLVGTEVYEGGFRLRYSGRPHPIEVTGVERAVRAHHGWGPHALELHGDMLLHTLMERRPLLGFARPPRAWEVRSPVLWLVSPKGYGQQREE